MDVFGGVGWEGCRVGGGSAGLQAGNM